jgi:hypothetical protein
METAQAELLVFLLNVTAMAQLVALLFVVVWNARAAKRVGPRILVVRRRMAWRYAFLAGVALIGLGCLLVEAPIPSAQLPAAAVLGLSAALLALQPGFADSRCGERGVQIGWHALRYEDLPEWRLTGDHLRWRLGEIWVACDLPVAQHEAMRTKLEQLAPGRESRFSR